MKSIKLLLLLCSIAFVYRMHAAGINAPVLPPAQQVGDQNIAWVFRSDYVLGGYGGVPYNSDYNGNINKNQLLPAVLGELRDEYNSTASTDVQKRKALLVKLFVAETIQSLLHDYFNKKLTGSKGLQSSSNMVDSPTNLIKDQDYLNKSGVATELVGSVQSFLVNIALTYDILNSYDLFSTVKLGEDRGKKYINRSTFMQLNNYLNLVYKYATGLLLGQADLVGIGTEMVAALKSFSTGTVRKTKVPDRLIGLLRTFVAGQQAKEEAEKKAATSIQAVLRGHKGRQHAEATEQQTIAEKEAKEATAATKIQARRRGQLGRRAAEAAATKQYVESGKAVNDLFGLESSLDFLTTVG